MITGAHTGFHRIGEKGYDKYHFRSYSFIYQRDTQYSEIEIRSKPVNSDKSESIDRRNGKIYYERTERSKKGES